MKSAKTMKRALGTSIIAMILSIAMFAGTTLAWFTDSVVSQNNKIIAGNLDIELNYWDGSQYKPVEANTELFDSDARWEPGHVEVAYLELKNAGTLHLKHTFAIENIADMFQIRLLFMKILPKMI